MKRIFYGFALFILCTSFMYNAVNKNGNGSNIVPDTIFTLKQDLTEVVSHQNGIQCHLFFNQTGDIVKCTRYYKEKDLSPFIVAKVKFKYPGYKIYGVTELTNSAGLMYLIVIEDTQTWMHIESNDSGYLTLKKKYKKA